MPITYTAPRPFWKRGKPLDKEERWYYNTRLNKNRIPPVEEDIERMNQVITKEFLHGIDLGSHSNYSDEQKIMAATVWFVTGSMFDAARKCNIPLTTLNGWKSRTSWWPEVIAELRRTKSEEFDAKCSKIIEDTLAEMDDRIKNGNEYVNLRTGEKYRKKCDLRELATTFNIMFEKRQLLRGEPTSVRSTVKPDQVLSNLKKQFEKVAHDEVQKQLGKPIEGERIG